MLGLSTGEIVLTAMVVTMIFGWSWIPRIGQGIGALFDGVQKGMREDDPRISVRALSPNEARDERAGRGPKSPTDGESR
jgi:Sec-independent protein translocase protein TatA